MSSVISTGSGSAISLPNGTRCDSWCNADTDRKTKLWACAHAEVPLHVLIDRFAETGPTVELFSSPDGGAHIARSPPVSS